MPPHANSSLVPASHSSTPFVAFFCVPIANYRANGDRGRAHRTLLVDDAASTVALASSCLERCLFPIAPCMQSSHLSLSAPRLSVTYVHLWPVRLRRHQLCPVARTPRRTLVVNAGRACCCCSLIVSFGVGCPRHTIIATAVAALSQQSATRPSGRRWRRVESCHDALCPLSHVFHEFMHAGLID